MNETEYKETIFKKIAEADTKSIKAGINKTACSMNNRLVLEVYKTDKALKAMVQNGIARPEQKTAVKGLRVLMNAMISNATGNYVIPKNSVAYIREQTLHTNNLFTTALQSDALEEPFIIVDLSYVEFIAG